MNRIDDSPLEPLDNYFLLFQSYYGNLLGWNIRTRVPMEDVQTAIKAASHDWLCSREGCAFIQEVNVREGDIDYSLVMLNIPEEILAEHGIYMGTPHSGIIALNADDDLVPEEKDMFSLETLEKVRRFATQLAAWDKRIVEVFAVGSLVVGQVEPGKPIDLVCRFDPEPKSASSGFFNVINLSVRDDHEGFSRTLGIETPIDLSFTIGECIFMPGGEVVSIPEKKLKLWAIVE